MIHQAARMEDATSAAQDAFWAVIAERYPEAEFGDFGPHESAVFDEACANAVRLWVSFNVPRNPLERLHNRLVREGFAPTWGDENGTCLWVALEWPAERFDRRIEITHSDMAGFEMSLHGEGDDPLVGPHECDFYLGTGFEDSRFTDESVVVDAILTFARITHTCFEYETGRA